MSINELDNLLAGALVKWVDELEFLFKVQEIDLWAGRWDGGFFAQG